MEEKQKMEENLPNNSTSSLYDDNNLQEYMKKIRLRYEDHIKRQHRKDTDNLIKRHKKIISNHISSSKKEIENITKTINKNSKTSFENSLNHRKKLDDTNINLYSKKIINTLLQIQQYKRAISNELFKYFEKKR